MDNPEKLATLGTQEEDKHTKKHTNTICAGQHHMQTSTNNVDKIRALLQKNWKVRAVMKMCLMVSNCPLSTILRWDCRTVWTVELCDIFCFLFYYKQQRKTPCSNLFQYANTKYLQSHHAPHTEHLVVVDDQVQWNGMYYFQRAVCEGLKLDEQVVVHPIYVNNTITHISMTILII